MSAEVIQLRPTKADLDKAWQEWLDACQRRKDATLAEHEAGERYQRLSMEVNGI